MERIIGVRFHDLQLLQQALTHKSYLNEVDSSIGNNERLEFLGDTVLNCVVSEYLYRETSFAEGKMTALRSSLVSTEALAEVGRELKIAPHIFLSKGERKSFDGNGGSRTYIIAGIMEAIIGAITIDRGLGNAQLFVKEFILPRLRKIIQTKSYIDPKTHFQELAQEKLQITPEYRVVDEQGPDHAKTFIVAVYLKDRQIAKGEGTSIKRAEVEAAKRALKEEFRVTLKNE